MMNWQSPIRYIDDCDDRVIRWMERWWRAQQLPWALALGAAGGPLWIVWGVFGRVLASTYGHFFVGWYAHNDGDIQDQNFKVIRA